MKFYPGDTVYGIGRCILCGKLTWRRKVICFDAGASFFIEKACFRHFQFKRKEVVSTS